MHLATFIHISDLHFGEVDPNTFDAKESSWLGKIPWFDGIVGHSYRSLSYLVDFVSSFRSKEKVKLFKIIVTGDLTAYGHPNQFDLANQFLSSNISGPDGNYIGLAESDWKLLAVPGNHDHWPGTPKIFGDKTLEFDELFAGRWWQTTLLNLGTAQGHKLRFIKIDSDSNVKSVSYSRFLARGDFKNQLDLVKNHIPTDSAYPEIRVLLIHHSRLHSDRLVMGMDRSSRDALDEFIRNYNIRVVLTGHLHSPDIKQVPISGTTFMEARCGTTTQKDITPYGWTNMVGNRSKRILNENTLLVHRLIYEDNHIDWRSETYTRDPKSPKGFRLAGPRGEISVWPGQDY